MQTLLLDVSTWDIVLDANGNIAVASEPYSLAQDAASAIKLFQGEYFWDTTQGVPYGQILGRQASFALVKAQLTAAAETVPDVATAKTFLTSFTGRTLSGQVQVTSASSGQTGVANFAVVNPQGTNG